MQVGSVPLHFVGAESWTQSMTRLEPRHFPVWHSVRELSGLEVASTLSQLLEQATTEAPSGPSASPRVRSQQFTASHHPLHVVCNVPSRSRGLANNDHFSGDQHTIHE